MANKRQKVKPSNKEPMSLRASDYTIYVKLPAAGKFLLVHGYTGAIDLVQANVVEFLKNFGKPHQKAVVAQSTVEVLQKRGYLTEKASDEERTRVRKLAETLHKHQLKAGKGFLFIPAYDCNFNCPYCYEAAISRNGTGWTKEVMTKELVDAAYAAIQQVEPDVERCKRITLYGGEPLLAKNCEIVKYIIEKGLQRGHTFGAITNGYELHHYLEFIGKGKIEFLQITLDGPPEVHDRRRTLRDGKGSFEAIQRNICAALETGAMVSVRINSDKQNILTLGTLTEMFREYGWLEKSNFRAYASPAHTAGRKEPGSNDIPIDQSCADATLHFRRLEFVTHILGEKTKSQSVSIFDDNIEVKRIMTHALTSGSLMPFKPSFCGANFGMFIFDPRGDLYTCWELVGQHEAKVGRYVPGLALDRTLLDQWQRRTVSNIPRCAECKYAMFCGGGCEAFAYNRTGCFFSSYCDDFPRVFAKFAAVAYQEYAMARLKPKSVEGPST